MASASSEPATALPFTECCVLLGNKEHVDPVCLSSSNQGFNFELSCVCHLGTPNPMFYRSRGRKKTSFIPPRTSSLLERRTCILFVLSCLFAFSYLVANGNSASNLILTGELLSRTHILSTATRMLSCRLSCLFVPCCLHWDLFKGCSHVSFCLVPSEPGAECGAVGAEHEQPH